MVGRDQHGRRDQATDRDGGRAVVHGASEGVAPAHQHAGVAELRGRRGAGDHRACHGGYHGDEPGPRENRCGRATHRRNQRRMVSTDTASSAARTMPMMRGPEDTGASGGPSPGASTVYPVVLVAPSTVTDTVY